ncbi:MAG: HAD-IB family phosphatase [Acidiferrobacterales bacterium]
MRWPRYEHVFFDCDSTLTSVEGIDALAAKAGVGESVEELTRAAMDGALDLDDVYRERLEAINPTRGAVRALREVYKSNVVEDAAAVVHALMKLGHQVYIISGGLHEPVREFGISLGVPPENIRGVGVDYNQLAGEWWRSRDDAALHKTDRYLDYRKSALAESRGKADIVKQFLNGQSGRSLLIGDGISDLLAASMVDLFLGYGGVMVRARVEREAPIFMRCASLAPVLALAAGPAALRQCRDNDAELVEKTITLVASGALEFRPERLRTRFTRAWEAQYGALR